MAETLAALDFRPTGSTLINSILRRPEAYHGTPAGDCQESLWGGDFDS